MTHHAEGRFEVEIVPQAGPEAPLGRMTIAERFTGGLAGIAGSLAIDIRDGQHFCRLDDTLPE